MTSPIDSDASLPRSTLRKRRRIIVVVVPPVEELDLVGPLQVFSSVNRLAGQVIYSIEVVTNTKRLEVDGESGLLTFLAQCHFQNVKGKLDSVLLVCGVGTRTTRDPALFAWLKKTAASVRLVSSPTRGTKTVKCFPNFPGLGDEVDPGASGLDFRIRPEETFGTDSGRTDVDEHPVRRAFVRLLGITPRHYRNEFFAPPTR